MNPLSREARLERIYQEYQQDGRFEHFRQPGINFVPGRGSLRPAVVFVGEAPGRNENNGGEPFIGRAGAVLDELLDTVSVVRADTFITNVVKYRPPGNRTPTPVESAASTEYLQRELNVLRPNVVGLLGAVAVRTVFGQVAMGQVHGHTLTQRTGSGYRTYIALYHPAFGIYDPRNRDMMSNDFKKIVPLLSSITNNKAGVI